MLNTETKKKIVELLASKGMGSYGAREVVEALEPIVAADPCLPNYNRDEDSWPVLWRLPFDEMQEAADDEGDTFTKFAVVADDIAVREMIHIWDNAMRAPLPDLWAGILGGLITAHARLAASMNGPEWDLEKAADAVRQAWLAMVQQAVRVRESGSWDTSRAN